MTRTALCWALVTVTVVSAAYVGKQEKGKKTWARILVQVTIYRRLLIGRDGHLDQSEAYVAVPDCIRFFHFLSAH